MESVLHDLKDQLNKLKTNIKKELFNTILLLELLKYYGRLTMITLKTIYPKQIQI
jgi:hypothetical protein